MIRGAYQRGASIYGDASDGDATVSVVDETLTRDMYFNNLTINSTFVLNMAGWRLFVRGTLTVVGTISAAGEPGGSASDQFGAQGGAEVVSGSVAGNVLGGTGGDGDALGAGPGYSGDSTSGEGGIGNGGGNGGDGSVSSGGASGGGGGVTVSRRRVFSPHFVGGPSIILIQGGAGGGGGGAGGTGSGPGGGGGGGGAGGGVVFVFARIIANSGLITAAGGNGGDGAPAGGTIGAGGGGGGGGGGCVFLAFDSYQGAGSVNADGSTEGFGGDAGGARDGLDGYPAPPGTVIRYNRLSGVFTVS